MSDSNGEQDKQGASPDDEEDFSDPEVASRRYLEDDNEAERDPLGEQIMYENYGLTLDDFDDDGNFLPADEEEEDDDAVIGKAEMAKVKEVAKAVSETLGVTPLIALRDYINPDVFKSWRRGN